MLPYPTTSAMPAPVLPAAAEVPHGVDLCPGWLVSLLEWLQTASDLTGMAAITIGFLGGVWIWLAGEISLRLRARGDRWMIVRRARLFLGNYILLGLELMIVSDLIHSFLKPDLDSLFSLGLMVVIRTAISYFLGKELEAVRHEEQHREKRENESGLVSGKEA